ncbi:unnamed protein product [Paramecium sonneborni]|uniref:Transmembrane protein n=1 Tax=Paramecium sonneborni TaxID=65129 RepID=A0A8S1Q098_9CILI|nr:unnamed protein product [Paramecium sonneborni]
MILIISLFRMCLCENYYVSEQTKLILSVEWDDIKLGLGVLSQYCPMGVNKYQYEQSSDHYYYFLQSAYFGERNEFLYLIYMEIQTAEKQFIFYVQFNLEGKWIECTFPFKAREVEGILIKTIIYYQDTEQFIIEQLWGHDQRFRFTFPYTYLPKIQVTLNSGGIYSDINPITNKNILLKQFPGQMKVVRLFEKDLERPWNDLIEPEGLTALILEKEIINLEEKYSNMFYTISTITGRYYKVSFWAKTEKLYDNSFNQIIHIIRVVANRYTQDFKVIGSNSFVLEYVYNRLTQQWKFRINFYSYIIPILIPQMANDNLLNNTDEFIIEEYSYINTWHFITIQYQPNNINFNFENPKFNYQINKLYEDVYQFSQIYYRLYLGGLILDANTLTRSFALISFYDYNQEYFKCHISCQTCFGPQYNNCQSCPPDSNRVFNPNESTCQCQLWYVEISDQICKLVTNQEIILTLEDDYETETINCLFGEFEYNGNCYQCPLAGQDNQIICSACLMRPTDWIQNPKCLDIYYQHQNNPNNQYVQLIIDEELSNLYYIFQSAELQPCHGCKICQNKEDKTCQLSSYTHLDMETYIKCLKGYYFSNGECLIQKKNLVTQKLSCRNSCIKCSNGYCLICSDQNNFFLNYMGQCQLCSITHCKYCFQYNLYNLNENSILNNRSDNKQISEDFEVGCALCQTGYIYSFQSNQCHPSYDDNGCKHYINYNEQIECYSTQFDKLSSKFQQIDNCQNNLSNCDQCIYSNFGMLICIQCSYGFFINKVNGQCNKCLDLIAHHVQHCQIVDKANSFYKLSLLGFLQYSTQQLNDLITIFNDFNSIQIVECQNNFMVDKIQNQCVDSCTNCDHCDFINGQKQCLKCTFQLDYISNYYSQKLGKCYRCPQLCKFCLQIDEDLIQKYNPYFTITEQNINQAMKCLINFDQNLTYLDKKSGLIQPFNNLTNSKQFYSAYINYDYFESSSYDDIIYKSVRKIYYHIQSLNNNQYPFLKNYYSVANLIVNLEGVLYDDESLYYIINVSEVRAYQRNFEKEKHFYDLQSFYGVKLYAENCTIQQKILQKLFIINQPLLVNLTIFNIQDISFEESQVITINSYFKNSHLILQHFLFYNTTFLNSVFIQHFTDKYDSIYFFDLTFTNCSFKESIWFFQKGTVTINLVQMSHIKFINCTFRDSLAFQITESTDSFSITDFQVINCSFFNSSLFKGFSNLKMNQIWLDNLSVIQSDLFIYSFSQSNQTVFLTQLICQGLLLNKSSIFFFENRLKYLQTEVIIIDWNLEVINLQSTLGYISDSFIFIVSNVNIKIQDLIIQKSILFSLLIFQNCQVIMIKNIQILQREKIEQSLDTLDSQIQTKYLMYFSEFIQITIDNLKVIGWVQKSESFLIIKSDSSASKFIQISDFTIDDYSNYNILNQINSILFIQIDAVIQIKITKSHFKKCNFWYRSPNTDMMSATLLRIKAPKSQILLDNLIFNIANIYNSFDSLIYIDAKQISMLNSEVEHVNSQINNDQLKSICGFSIFLAEYINIINTTMSNIKSSQYGFIYSQLKFKGNFKVINCIFNNHLISNNNSYLTQLGGIFTIDGKLSMLNLNFINVSVLNIYVEEKAAFLYLIPSSLSNQIYMYNLTLINVISKDNLMGKLQFPYQSQNNQIVMNKIRINNSENSSQIQRLIEKEKSLQRDINYEGVLSTAYSSVLINDFIYEGYLTQPICKLDVTSRLRISNFKFVFLSILNKIPYFIDINIQGGDLVSVENMYFEKINFEKQLEYFFKFNCFLLKNGFISNQIKFKEMVCPQCQNGLITIVNNQNQFEMKVTEYIFIDNNCGINSCLILQNIQLEIKDSYFINNFAQKNGIISGIRSDLYLQNSIIKQNKIIGLAGAIFLNSSILDAQNLIIVNNSANIGGAIYCENSILKLKMSKKRNIMLIENFASTGLNNIREKAVFLKLNMFGLPLQNTRQIQEDQILDSPSYIINQKQMSKNDTFINVASGQQLKEFKEFDKVQMKYNNYTISVEIEKYNQLGEKIIDNQGEKCQLTQYQVNSELNQTNYEIIQSSKIENITYLYFDEMYESFKLDNISFILEPYTNQSIFLLILIKCEGMSQNYNFIFKIKTLQCQIGEYYNQKQCLRCDADKGYYSLKKDSIECQRLDPTKMKAVTSYQIEILQGFWRYSYYSDNIEQCENFDNCLGGWNVNYESCAVGSIGAICNECDIYNIRGQSSYIKTLSGLCEKKEQQQDIFIITIILMIFTFVVTYVISFLKTDMYIQYKKMKYKTIHHRILYRCEIDQLNTNLKLLINFMQILYPILPPLKFSDNFSAIAWTIGKSSKTLLFLINFLADNFEIEILYLKMIWAVIIPIIQISTLLFAYISINRIIKNSDIQVIFIQASCIFLMCYSMPNIMEELIVVISRRTIVNIDWIGANLSYIYYTDEHQTWIWQFVIPSICLIYLVIPLIIFGVIYKMHQKSNFDLAYGIYGYLCSDFKSEFYFWELVNLQMKLTLIFILFFFDNDQIILKNLIVIVILFGYYGSIANLKPYLKTNLNHLEKSGIILCCVLISLNVLKVASNKYFYTEVLYLTEILMFLIVLLILFYTLFKIFGAFIHQNYKFFDRIRKKINSRFPNLINYGKFFELNLKIRSEIRKNTFYRFQRIKLSLKRLKQNNNRSARVIINHHHEDLVTNILRSDQKSLIQQYSIQNSMMN